MTLNAESPGNDCLWRCPLCKLNLVQQDKSWRCASEHCFDLAKQGYVNLLLSSKKNSREPGDSREMIAARREFLAKGFYQPVQSYLREVIATRLSTKSDKATCVLDLGCGEGYYLEGIDLACTPVLRKIAVRKLGIDISKFAIKSAARYKGCEFAVASTFDIPLANATCDVAYSVFSPASEDEIRRVLRPDGLFIKVGPGPRHLTQLKQALYETPSEHAQHGELENFRKVQSKSLSFSHRISAEDMKNLLFMTPLHWHGSRDAKHKLLEEGLTELQFDFQLSLYEPTPVSDAL